MFGQTLASKTVKPKGRSVIVTDAIERKYVVFRFEEAARALD